jgi:hypothetical protein
MVAGGKEPEEAVEIMRQSWRAQHRRDLDAWNEHVGRRRTTPGGREDGTAATTPGEKQPKWLDRPTPGFLDLQPARHILKKLEKKEYVELWHFTAQGCKDAALIDITTPDDTFGLVSTEKGLMLQSVEASSASPKAIRDESLSWDQLSEGKRRLLEAMSSCGWSEHEVRELARFYLSLDLHPIRSQDYGLQAVLRYQDRVRQEWVKSIRLGVPFAIGAINDDLMRDYQGQIALEIQARNNVCPSPQFDADTLNSNELSLLERHAKPAPPSNDSAPIQMHPLRTILPLHRTISAPAPHHIVPTTHHAHLHHIVHAPHHILHAPHHTVHAPRWATHAPYHIAPIPRRTTPKKKKKKKNHRTSSQRPASRHPDTPSCAPPLHVTEMCRRRPAVPCTGQAKRVAAETGDFLWREHPGVGHEEPGHETIQSKVVTFQVPR